MDTSGGWTVSLDNINGTDVVAAVGVPAHGAVINIPTGSGTKCALSVTGTAAGNKAQSALADFYNGDEETDARLEVDTQLKYTEDASSTTGHCAAISVPVTSPTTGDATSQFEADFVVTSNQGPVRVIP